MQISPVSNNFYKQKNGHQKNVPSFGYYSFLKHLPITIDCAYCGKQTLATHDLKKLGKTLEKVTGQEAIAKLKNHYNRLNPSQQFVVNILSTALTDSRNTNKTVPAIISNLANIYENSTNLKYEEAFMRSLEASGITKKSPLYQVLFKLIDNSKKTLFFRPDKNSGQKVLKITSFNNDFSQLYKATTSPEDKEKLKKFYDAINLEFDYIKDDPTTFFPKFGNDTMASFLGSLYEPLRRTVDHIIPACKKGASRDENYLITCKKCNNDKGNIPLHEFAKTHKKIPIFIKRQFDMQLDRLLHPKQLQRNDFDIGTAEQLKEYLLTSPQRIEQELGQHIDFNMPNLRALTGRS